MQTKIAFLVLFLITMTISSLFAATGGTPTEVAAPSNPVQVSMDQTTQPAETAKDTGQSDQTAEFLAYSDTPIKSKTKPTADPKAEEKQTKEKTEKEDILKIRERFINEFDERVKNGEDPFVVANDMIKREKKKLREMGYEPGFAFDDKKVVGVKVHIKEKNPATAGAPSEKETDQEEENGDAESVQDLEKQIADLKAKWLKIYEEYKKDKSNRKIIESLNALQAQIDQLEKEKKELEETEAAGEEIPDEAPAEEK